ncbi:MAG: S41 family peptidase [Sedimenticola sp.]|nr:S41 family peptidase [Sedimenticola sp.]
MDKLSAGNLEQGLKHIDPWARLQSVDEAPVGVLKFGIGAELYRDAEGLWLMPYSGGPLFRAGFEDRVKLHAINGNRVAGMSSAEVTAVLTGVDGVSLEIDLCTDGCQSTEHVSLLPEYYSQNSVEEVYVSGQRQLRLRHFASRETRAFLQTLLLAEDTSRALILDLRDCQGGDLFEAMDSAAMFLHPGKSLTSTYSRKGLEQRYFSPPGRKFSNPLTLLISGNTASAGEIFAGILQAHGRAQLVGVNSRGKCVSQAIRTLSNGSLLHYTNLEIVLPDESHCQGSGLQPDLVLSNDEVKSSQLILRRLLKGVGAKLPSPMLDKR